jgi:hypothetical protein
MNTNFRATQKISLEPRCTVKTSAWGKFNDLGAMPSTFIQFVATLSKKYFPDNFTISFISADFQTASIDNANIYESMLAYLRINGIKEAKFFVTLVKEERISAINRKSETFRESNEINYYSSYSTDENSEKEEEKNFKYGIEKKFSRNSCCCENMHDIIDDKEKINCF